MRKVRATRKSYHHGDLPQAMLRAAYQALRDGGAEALSLRDVARRVGVNHRAAYRHFQDKRALLAAVAAQGYRDLAAQLRRALGQASEDGRLLALARAYVEWAAHEQSSYALMTGPRLNEDDRFPDLEAAISEAFDLLTEELRAASGCTDRTRIRDAALSLWAAVHGVAGLILVRRVRVKPTLLGAYATVLLRPAVEGVVRSLKA